MGGGVEKQKTAKLALNTHLFQSLGNVFLLYEGGMKNRKRRKLDRLTIYA